MTTPPPLTDSSSAQAFEALFRAHYGALCRFAYRYVGDHAHAEELVQSVFAAMWATRAERHITHSEKSYLFASVRNAALNDRKHSAIQRTWFERESARTAHESPHAPSPDELLDRTETAERVSRAMAALPERCRMVMELRWREQLSYAEIAEVMGISVKGVENQLARGLDRLRTILD